MSAQLNPHPDISWHICMEVMHNLHIITNAISSQWPKIRSWEWVSWLDWSGGFPSGPSKWFTCTSMQWGLLLLSEQSVDQYSDWCRKEISPLTSYLPHHTLYSCSRESAVNPNPTSSLTHTTVLSPWQFIRISHLHSPIAAEESNMWMWRKNCHHSYHFLTPSDPQLLLIAEDIVKVWVYVNSP